MIEINGINKQFKNLKVLKDVTIRFADANITALIGPNASGKTTLIKILLGMVIPDSGDITVMGKAIKDHWQYRQSIGYMPQIGRYPENMEVGHVLSMVQDIRQRNGVELDKELYERFRLHEILRKKMGTLSGGTRQKVSAYLAFLFSPQILILDEPTAGLDPLSALILKEKIVSENKKGKLVIISSHVLSELDDIVNHVVYLEEGEIAMDKSIQQLKADTNTQKLADAIAHVIKSKNR